MSDLFNIDEYLNTYGVKTFYFDCIDSTSTKARELIGDNPKEKLLVVCNEQTSGRGRNGKSFFSPQGNIYMSVVLHPDCAFNDAVSVTTAAAVAVNRAVERVTGIKTQIKWVNDLYYCNKKVCGILCEAVGKNGFVSSVIIGVGINLVSQVFPDELKSIAGDLGSDASLRDALIAAVADELFALPFGRLSDELLAEYTQKSIVIGKTIEYTENGKKNTATAVGIDSAGGLIVVNSDESRKVLSSGEITVRLCE